MQLILDTICQHSITPFSIAVLRRRVFLPQPPKTLPFLSSLDSSIADTLLTTPRFFRSYLHVSSSHIFVDGYTVHFEGFLSLPNLKKTANN